MPVLIRLLNIEKYLVPNTVSGMKDSGANKIMAKSESLKPTMGGFQSPFGCVRFIVDFLKRK